MVQESSLSAEALLAKFNHELLDVRELNEVTQIGMRYLSARFSPEQVNLAEFDFEGGQAKLTAVGQDGELRSTLVPVSQLENMVETLRQGGLFEATGSQVPWLFRDGRIQGDGCSRSYVSLPLATQEILIGSINLRLELGHSLQPNELDTVREMAKSMAVVFRRVHLQNETLAEVKRLRQQQQEIIQEERLNAVGGIASAIVHDFNNALTPILGFSEVLLKRPETLNNSAQTLRYLQIINEAALEAAEAVRRLRRFYRPREEHDVFQRVNPHQLVQAAILAAKAKWAESAASGTPKITVETALENVPPIRGNEIELCEAFVHIITNAFQATLCDGIVKVAVRNAGKHVCFEVQDSGEGMTEDVKKRCIEPFFTTRKRAAGLGLSVVHGVVRRHGGSLEIESQEGVGSTIRMFLPIDER